MDGILHQFCNVVSSRALYKALGRFARHLRTDSEVTVCNFLTAVYASRKTRNGKILPVNDSEASFFEDLTLRVKAWEPSSYRMRAFSTLCMYVTLVAWVYFICQEICIRDIVRFYANHANIMTGIVMQSLIDMIPGEPTFHVFFTTAARVLDNPYPPYIARVISMVTARADKRRRDQSDDEPYGKRLKTDLLNETLEVRLCMSQAEMITHNFVCD